MEFFDPLAELAAPEINPRRFTIIKQMWERRHEPPLCGGCDRDLIAAPAMMYVLNGEQSFGGGVCPFCANAPGLPEKIMKYLEADLKRANPQAKFEIQITKFPEFPNA